MEVDNISNAYTNEGEEMITQGPTIDQLKSLKKEVESVWVKKEEIYKAIEFKLAELRNLVKNFHEKMIVTLSRNNVDNLIEEQEHNTIKFIAD
jgi:hypothetical protein